MPPLGNCKQQFRKLESNSTVNSSIAKVWEQICQANYLICYWKFKKMVCGASCLNCYCHAVGTMLHLSLNKVDKQRITLKENGANSLNLGTHQQYVLK